jgi:predicted aconitase with swiveling domain
MRSIIMAIIVKGRSISKGCAEGEALVCRQPIGFNFGIDVSNGVITEYKHELFGKSIKDRILLFPHGKGSTGGSYVVYQLAKNKTGPKAIINMTTETIIAVGAIMAGIPVIDSLEKNPYDLIFDGDHVKVDADHGLVVIEK